MMPFATIFVNPFVSDCYFYREFHKFQYYGQPSRHCFYVKGAPANQVPQSPKPVPLPRLFHQLLFPLMGARRVIENIVKSGHSIKLAPKSGNSLFALALDFSLQSVRKILYCPCCLSFGSFSLKARASSMGRPMFPVRTFL